MSVMVGKVAPDFKAPCYFQGAIGETELSGYRGRWVVLFFYPGDFTCVCPTELAALAAKYPAFKELDAEILAISTDSPEAHARWNEAELERMVPGGVRFPMLSDPEGSVGFLYGVYDVVGTTYMRGRFIIDPDGVVQSMEIVSDSMGRSIPETLRQIRALRNIRVSGELMPCGWEPGKPTLPTKDDAPSHSGRIWDIWNTRNAF